MAYAFHSSTLDTDTGRLGVWGQPRLHSKKLTQNKQTDNNKETNFPKMLLNELFNATLALYHS
jgi:hypothetical protein